MTWLARKTAFDIATQRFPTLAHDREGFDKALENWTSVGKECPIVRQGNRIGFDDAEYEKWLKRIEQSLITLDKQDYLKYSTLQLKPTILVLLALILDEGKHEMQEKFSTTILGGN